MFGTKFYNLEYEADVKVLDDFDGRLIVQGVWSIVGKTNPGTECEIEGPLSAGKVYPAKGCIMLFNLTENGWKAPDGKVY